MLRIVMNALRTGVVTTRYPAQPSAAPERFRGAPVLRPGSRLPPPAVCPAGALSEHLEAGVRHVALDLARCVFCGRCAEDPWKDAVAMGRDFELAARRRDDLRIEVVADDPAVGTASPAPDPDAQAARASSEIHQVLGRSLHLRHLDAGSCNACDWELAALLNPVYDVRRLGIDFVASPRHADGVVVTGPVTRNLETAVRRTVEAIPDPRVVIAVGACAASGGIVGEGYASAGGVDRIPPSRRLHPRLPTAPASHPLRHPGRGRAPRCAPVLGSFSPEKRCGKTNVLVVVRMLALRGRSHDGHYNSLASLRAAMPATCGVAMLVPLRNQ